MVAAVVSGGKGRAVDISVCGKVCVIEVGCRASRRRLRALLGSFGGDFVLAEGLRIKNISGFDGSRFAEKLLFRSFHRYIRGTGRHCGRVGVFDPDGRFLPSTAGLLSLVTELMLVTDSVDEALLEDCLKLYGTCPDIAQKEQLYGCDTVFCPQGLPGFDGTLFGKGGITVCGDRLALPEYCRTAVEKGIDPISLAALLELERDVDLSGLLPEFVCFKGVKMPFEELLSARGNK